MALTPTLWRTSRVLAGPVRLNLLRQILGGGVPCVMELAAAAGLSEPRASQELRRLQARGLVRAVRQGRYLVYRPVPDPKVPSAKLLLAAARAALAGRPDAETLRVAQAFGHDRRLTIVRTLLRGPQRASRLCATTGIPVPALFRHLGILAAGGLVRRTRSGWELAPSRHPLAKALHKLLVQA